MTTRNLLDDVLIWPKCLAESGHPDENGRKRTAAKRLHAPVFLPQYARRNFSKKLQSLAA
eukprot:3413124-Pleurochrysis_carterae.AAC.4